MAYLQQKRRFYLYILFAVLIVSIGVIAGQFRDDSPVFLVTGDFDKPGDFSQDVFDGANKAAARTKGPTGKESPRVLKLYAKGTDSLAEFRARFLKIHTSYNIVAVISADISTVAPMVVKVANSYNIPVLLTVATSDNVMGPRKGDLSFRLVPRDSKQAESIASWCRDKKYPAIIHGGQTPYGRFLGSKLVELRSQEGSSLPLVSSYFDSTEMFSLLTPICNLGVDAIVFVGYSDRFVEFFGKLQAIGWHGPVLLSDGCYSPSLIRRPPGGDLLLCYATNPTPRLDKHRIQANGVFGWDAYVLLSEAFHEMLQTKEPFPNALRTATESESAYLIETYRFGETGENESADFHIFRLEELAKGIVDGK